MAQNSEKFMTFSFGACHFKDSFAFLLACLDTLMRLNKYEVQTDKGINPYDYMNSRD